MRLAVVAGVIWGVFCGVVSGRPILTTLAQMAVPWIWVAALVACRSALNSKQASIRGGAALLAANIAYFAIAIASNAVAGLPWLGGLRFFALWATVGVVIGPVAGVLGWWLTVERRRFTAIVFLGALTMAEPLALWPHITHLGARVVYLGVAAGGLALPLVWLREDRVESLKALALMLALLYPAALILEAALIALGQVSPPMRLW